MNDLRCAKCQQLYDLPTVCNSCIGDMEDTDINRAIEKEYARCVKQLADFLSQTIVAPEDLAAEILANKQK